MGLIRVLDEATINQIAAGEVIENPAAAVKELVENSLDAGAKKIWVQIRGGGFQLIQVADNGWGMSRDDAVLCLERHATSKIKRIDDLNGLQSMGFRGEALASIGAISQLQLVTAQEGKDGVEVEVEGGILRGVRLASRAGGTTISVRSLFYNVPARKKFQKIAAATASEIHKLLLSLALAHPEVGFELTIGDAMVLAVSPEEEGSFLSKLERRLEKVLGISFLQGRRSLLQESGAYQVYGWLGSPADDRINRSGQYLFINKRAVTSPVVAAAIKAGYGHRLDERRYPIFILHLSAPPAEIDVNVHPQKKEVRFQKEGWLREFLQKATQRAFQEMPSSSVSFQERPPQFLPQVPLRFREDMERRSETWIEDPEVIGLWGPYLLLDASTISGEADGIVWVHLQKAQEAVLIRSLQEKGSGDPAVRGRSQGLLIPLPIPVNKQQQQELLEKQSVLEALGFSIEPSGKDAFLIHAVPSFIESGDAVEAVKLVLEGEDILHKIVAFAVRRKKRFMIQEALALWHQIKNGSHTGIIAKTGLYVVENFFK